MGRPSTYTPELGEKICDLIAAGQSLREICRQDDMPPDSVVRRWAFTDREGFAARYAIANQARALRWADEIIEISDDGSNDWMERQVEAGLITPVANTEHINRSRLRVDARKWLLSKLLPRQFGDRVEIAGDRDNPLMVETSPRDMSKALGLIVEELRARQIEGTLADPAGDET